MTLPNSCFSSIKGILKQGHDLIATRSNHLDTHCAMPSWTKMPTYSVSEYLSFSYKWTHNKTLWYKFSDFDSNKTLWYKFSDFDSNKTLWYKFSDFESNSLQLATRNLQLATRNSHFTLSLCVSGFRHWNNFLEKLIVKILQIQQKFMKISQHAALGRAVAQW